MMHATLDRYRVKPLPERFQPSNDVDLILSAHLGLDRGRREEQAQPALPEHLEHCAILDLGRDPRAQAIGGKPLIGRHAQRGVGRRNEQRRVVQ
jgi:hypothetical protein